MTRVRNSDFLLPTVQLIILAAQMLKENICEMQHVSCFSHLLARVACEIVEKTCLKPLVKSLNKIFKSAIRRHALKHFRVPENLTYPVPTKIRWGAFLETIQFVSKNWTQLKDFLATQSDCQMSKIALGQMENSENMAEVGLMKNLSFLIVYIKRSQSQNYCAPNASNDVQEIEEKSIDLKKTLNKFGAIALQKFQSVLQKNKGLLKVIKISKGQEITQPSDIGIFTFAPV